MRCKVCGREMKKTMGGHFIDGRWLQLEADYCFQHGSFVTNLALQNAIEVVPDVMQRDHIRPGLHVLIHKKAAAMVQQPVEGYVKEIVTNGAYHYKGIRVRLADGQIGRVVKILE